MSKVNEKYWMIIRNSDNYLKDAFLKKCSDMGLTISNDGETQTGIEHIQLGHVISVGTSDKFHINWARRIDYYADRGIVPVYDLTFDWALIMDRLVSYSLSQAPIENTTSNEDVSIDEDDDFEKETVEDPKYVTDNGDLIIFNLDTREFLDENGNFLFDVNKIINLLEFVEDNNLKTIQVEDNNMILSSNDISNLKDIADDN